jgi:hypothetical protein
MRLSLEGKKIPAHMTRAYDRKLTKFKPYYSRKSENHYYTTMFALSDNKLTILRQKVHPWWSLMQVPCASTWA